jgi:lipopolysaccharide transport protein LptA
VNKICFIALIALAGAWILRAQTNMAGTNAVSTNAVAEILALVTTNTPPPQPLAPKTNAPTKIDSDTADFDLNGRQAVYRGNVRVDSPQMKLTCAQLTVNLPPAGGRIQHVVAETNVVIDATDEKGATNHITSDKAVYDYNVQDAVTNETITLTGSPQIVNLQGTNTADVIVWDRANGHVHEKNPHMSGQNNDDTGANTNSSPVPNLF